MLSKRPGETFEPVTATRIGWNASRGFRPAAPRAPRSVASIVLRVEGLRRAQLVGGCADDRQAAVDSGGIDLDRREEEACVLRELAEALDLLLHERHGSANALLRPVVALFAEIGTRASAYSAADRARRYTPFIQSSFS